MNFYDLFDIAQLRAINAAISPTVDSIFRIKCREYSERFHTPLHIVMNELDPLFVLQSLYEDKYHPSIVNEELEELMDTLYLTKDPSYTRMSSEDTEAMVDMVLNKEIARLAKKKRPTQETIQEEIVTAKAKAPRSGSMQFKDLEKLESDAETNKSGFEDQ